MHYLLIYDVVPDYAERRGAHRDEHLALARAAHERGELVLAGALAEPTDAAVLLFQAGDSRVVEQFVASDPYVKYGLVTRWRVRPWSTVVGDSPAIRLPDAPAGLPRSNVVLDEVPVAGRGLIARTLERWSPRDLLTAWSAYWASLVAVGLGPALVAVARVTLPNDAHGSVSAGVGDGGLNITVANGGHNVFDRSTSLGALALWIAGPPLLLWVAWLVTRPDRVSRASSVGEDSQRVPTVGAVPALEGGRDALQRPSTTGRQRAAGVHDQVRSRE